MHKVTPEHRPLGSERARGLHISLYRMRARRAQRDDQNGQSDQRRRSWSLLGPERPSRCVGRRQAAFLPRSGRVTCPHNSFQEFGPTLFEGTQTQDTSWSTSISCASALPASAHLT
jgi:hypothetical protein